MHKPTRKELDAIIVVAVVTVVVLLPEGFGVVSAVLVAIFCSLAEYRRLARKSTCTSKQASS